MPHRKLQVYIQAEDFAVYANSLVKKLPRGSGDLADQLSRASTSIPLNIAEGARKYGRKDKRRYYATADGSAGESLAILQLLSRFGVIDEAEAEKGTEMLDAIGKMLRSLIASMERRKK